MAELREDIYGGGPQNDLLRSWLSMTITREMVCSGARGGGGGGSEG
jgi:hypothetical protein